LFRSDISVHVGRGILVQGHGQGENPQAAYDSATERIAKQLRRYKRRLRDHHRKAQAPDADARTAAQQYVLAGPTAAADIETDEPAIDQPMVIAEMATVIDRLTVGEAVMRMELADQEALMFRNAAHGGLNVVYRRSDGNFGWIDPVGENAGRN
jgi:hypothetical protein